MERVGGVAAAGVGATYATKWARELPDYRSLDTLTLGAETRVFARDGTLIGRILLPERCANLCFGGAKRNRLFMTASQSVYALYVEEQGAPGG